jgi:hypothetical protein
VGGQAVAVLSVSPQGRPPEPKRSSRVPVDQRAANRTVECPVDGVLVLIERPEQQQVFPAIIVGLLAVFSDADDSSENFGTFC